MQKFINLHDGKITVTTYRHVECLATTLDDIVTHAVAGWDGYLTAAFNSDALCGHPCVYDFLTQYGVKCGSQQHGSQPEDTAIFFMFADEEFTFIPADNTVLLGWGE